MGRKKFITRSPVDNWAYKHKVPVIYDLTKVPQADLGVLAAYGKIIPQSVINRFKLGILNIHPSLLPKYRGPSPIQAAISQGEAATGVSVIKVDEKIDHGPVVSQFTEKILPDDTTGSLRERLFDRGANFLVELLPTYLEGKIPPQPQNHQRATSTMVLTKQDGFIDLTKTPSKEIDRKIRAMDPWPGTWTYVQQKSKIKNQKSKRLKILKAHLEKEKLVLDEVQLGGKNPVSWKQFKQGYPNHEFVGS